MDFRDEVMVQYITGDDEWSPTRSVRGIIIDQNSLFYTIAVIEKKIIISKRKIVRIDNISQNRGPPTGFKFGKK